MDVMEFGRLIDVRDELLKAWAAMDVNISGMLIDSSPRLIYCKMCWVVKTCAVFGLFGDSSIFDDSQPLLRMHSAEEQKNIC